MEHCYFPLELLDFRFSNYYSYEVISCKILYFFHLIVNSKRINYQFLMNNFKSLFIVARYTVSLFVMNNSRREAGVTRVIFFSRRQRNGSNFIALPARVMKMRVFHVLRGNAIVI